MIKNPTHDQAPDYIFFNLKLAYDKYQTLKVLKLNQQAGYFAARVKMFLDDIDRMGLKPPAEMELQMKYIRETMSKDRSGRFEDFSTNPGRYHMNDTELPPYEPFKPHQGGVFGEKQTRMYRLLTMKHALKIEKLGMRVSRGVNVTQMVKKEFGLKGNRDKVIQQFEALLPDILAGFKPMPGWKEEPNAWLKNRTPDAHLRDAHPHDPTQFQSNPSEPTYEPDPFRQDDEGAVPTSRDAAPQEFQTLFQMARDWQKALEAGRDNEADRIEGDIRYIIRFIEAKGFHPHPSQSDKYEKVYAFFSGHYGNNQGGHGGRRPGAGRPRLHPAFSHTTSRETKPFVVRSKNARPVAFRTINAAILYAREKASEAKSRGVGDVFVVFHTTTGSQIARFTTTGPVFERVFIKDTQSKRSSESTPGTGLIRRKSEFQENPWLVAGPNVNLMDQLPGASSVPAMPAAEGVSGHIPLAGEEIKETKVRTIAAEGKAVVSVPERLHKSRSRIARRQRRNKHGRFYDNPGSADEGKFIKVYEFEKGNQTFTGYFKFDSAAQIVTIRATETKAGTVRGYELDVMADDGDAAHLFKMLKKNGFMYLAKRLAKSKSVRGKRAYEKAMEYGHPYYKPTSGEALPGSPSGGVTPPTYTPTPTYGKSDQDVISGVQGYLQEVRRAVAEDNYPEAVGALLKIRKTMSAYGERGDAIWAIGWASDDARAAIENRWPGAIKKLHVNR